MHWGFNFLIHYKIDQSEITINHVFYIIRIDRIQMFDGKIASKGKMLLRPK